MSLTHRVSRGGPPEFAEPLHVGRPNVGQRDRFLERAGEILDRAWFTNHGPVVQQFESMLQERLGVDHVVAVCNATLGLELAVRAAGATGEVIVPAFTFVATAHAIQWQGLTPVLADIDPSRHVIDVDSVASLITPRTSAIIGVHTWGSACDIDALTRLGEDQGLHVLYDAAHAIGCTYRGAPFGSNGLAEVFSFHATKYVNSFEGGAIATNDAGFASKLRYMVNFGFEGLDRVGSVGTNAKMTEVCAAMGLTSFESEPMFAARNRMNWEAYRAGFAEIPGISLYEYSSQETNSYQYVVVEVGNECSASRDRIVEELVSENCFARRYFFPGIHRMEPYASLYPKTSLWLPNTDSVCERVMILPTGMAVTPEIASRVCALVRRCVHEC